MLNTSQERGLGGETFIPTSGSRHHLAFLSRTETQTKTKKDLKTEPSHQQRPTKTGRTGASAGGRHRNPSFLRRRQLARSIYLNMHNTNHLHMPKKTNLEPPIPCSAHHEDAEHVKHPNKKIIMFRKLMNFLELFVEL
jgi:hypothetical protein